MIDITYLATGEGRLYLAGVKDVLTCELVGYAMDERMTYALTEQALWGVLGIVMYVMLMLPHMVGSDDRYYNH